MIRRIENNLIKLRYDRKSLPWISRRLQHHLHYLEVNSLRLCGLHDLTQVCHSKSEANACAKLQIVPGFSGSLE